MKVILSYGMGVESTAILLRWLEEPSTRWFDLEDLTVLTAMTGDEFSSTGRLVEEHILPRLRAHGVRYVQVAREDKSDSVAVLDDSRNPEKLYLQGRYRLSQEMLSAGTVPTAGGVRKCSIHAKGWPLDAWLERELGEDSQFEQVIGFNSGEASRAEKDQSYGGNRFPGRKASYPLFDWGWDRDACEAFIKDITGEDWPKSACAYCPFAAGKETVMSRFVEEPEAGGFAILLEYVSLCFNPRMTLYVGKSIRDLVGRRGDRASMVAFKRQLMEKPWAVFHLRRYYTSKGHALRSIKKITQDISREEAEAQIEAKGGGLDTYGIMRLGRIERVEDYYPAIEEFFVAAPAVVTDKSQPGFEPRWDRFLAGKVTPVYFPPKKKKSKKAPPVLARPNPVGIGPVFDFELEEDDDREEQDEWVRELGDILPDPAALE